MTKGSYLQILDDDQGRQRLREIMASDQYLMITPIRRPSSKLRTTRTGLKIMGIHADQVFINRESSKPELIVGRLGNSKKIQIIEIGWEVGIVTRPQPEPKSEWPVMGWPEWPEWPEWPKMPEWPR